MQRLMSAGTTTVLVSHNIDFLVRQCTRLIWLDGGMLVMDGEPQDVALEYRQQNGRAA
jgi:ABC-type polysaccharide/polyol phosphate transport system ATPase subunit